MQNRHTTPPRIALALAGGGPLGAIYEIGALCALDEALEGVDFNRLHHYVGVSAGGFIAAGLANGMTPRELCAAFIENDGQSSEVFDPSWLMVPAYGEFLRRGIMLPALAASAVWRATLGRRSLTHALERAPGGIEITQSELGICQARERRQLLRHAHAAHLRRARLLECRPGL